ncbi:tol-pal system YbgF family protein, partial [Patescibacteria group bacterium]
VVMAFMDSTWDDANEVFKDELDAFDAEHASMYARMTNGNAPLSSLFSSEEFDEIMEKLAEYNPTMSLERTVVSGHLLVNHVTEGYSLEFDKGDHEGAIKEYEKAVKFGKDAVYQKDGQIEPEFWAGNLRNSVFQLVSCYVETGQPEKAQEIYEENFHLFEDSEDYKEMFKERLAQASGAQKAETD